MNDSYSSYQELVKPSWSPPASVFGPVWSVLYVLIAISFGRVFLMAFRKEIPRMVAVPFVLNLVFNLSFTWIQFGLKNYALASADILLTLGTLVWAMIAIFPFSRWITYINIPYFLWVSFATILQLTITVMNG